MAKEKKINPEIIYVPKGFIENLISSGKLRKVYENSKPEDPITGSGNVSEILVPKGFNMTNFKESINDNPEGWTKEAIIESKDNDGK